MVFGLNSERLALHFASFIVNVGDFTLYLASFTANLWVSRLDFAAFTLNFEDFTLHLASFARDFGEFTVFVASLHLRREDSRERAEVARGDWACRLADDFRPLCRLTRRGRTPSGFRQS
jgi:hypothetical protein